MWIGSGGEVVKDLNNQVALYEITGIYRKRDKGEQGGAVEKEEEREEKRGIVIVVVRTARNNVNIKYQRACKQGKSAHTPLRSFNLRSCLRAVCAQIPTPACQLLALCLGPPLISTIT